MKRFLLSVLLVLIVVLGIGGCGHSAPVASQPNVVMRVLDPSLEQFGNLWQAEISRRFPNSVGLLVHGGDFVEGQWIVGDWAYRSGMHVRPIADVIREAHAAFPDRTIVVLACNPGHITLHVPASLVGVPVYYATASVWCVPDRDVPTVTPEVARLKMLFGLKARAAKAAKLDAATRWAEAPDVVGNIFEFIEAQ